MTTVLHYRYTHLYVFIDDYTGCHARKFMCNYKLRLAQTLKPFESKEKLTRYLLAVILHKTARNHQ